MAFRFSYKRKNKVGLIISDHTIRMVEVQQGQIEKAAKIKERYLPEGIIEEGRIIDKDTLSLIIEECVEKWRIKRKSIRWYQRTRN